MSYVIATTTDVVRWYRFDFLKPGPGSFVLESELDLRVVPRCHDKKTLVAAAQALGLKTWRAVKLP